MSAYGIFQTVTIALIVLWSAAYAARRLFPRTYRGVLAHLAQPLAASSHTLLRALGERLMPQQIASGAGCDSGGSCSSCGTCATTPSPPSDVRPLVFQPRTKP